MRGQKDSDFKVNLLVDKLGKEVPVSGGMDPGLGAILQLRPRRINC